MSSKHDEPLPREWEVVRVGDICNQRNEIVQPSGKGKYRFVGLEHVNSGETRIHNHDSDVNVKSSKFRFYAGDILYGKLRPYLDKAALTGFEGICSTDLLVLTAQNEKTLAEFLVYVTHSNKFIRHAISTTSGTNHPRTSWKAISKFKFGLPPCPEQRRIAEILTTADTAIRKVDDAIAKTERLKMGLMQELLTKGIGHEEFKDSEVGRIPRGWGVARLGDILELCQYGLSVKMSGEGKYPIVRMDEIENGNVVSEITKYVDLDEKILRNFKLEKGDILFNRTNSYELVGRTGIFLHDGNYVFASYLIRLRPKHELVDSLFLTFYLIFSSGRLKQLATRAVHQANINATNLKKFKVSFPEKIEEQRKIAEILSTIDKKLEFERKRKKKLERIKNGLMNSLISGKVRVKNCEVKND